LYDLVLVDEFQDFNKLESDFIGLLGNASPVLIVGDDDQALYSQLKGASYDFIRTLHQSGDYECFALPFCMHCPKAVVDAINAIVERAQQLHLLQGRIAKPSKPGFANRSKRHTPEGRVSPCL
jgi:superfamily I DNA/RNA helicase